MIKISRIEILDSFKILCYFNSNERRILDLKNVLDPNNRFVNKILNPIDFGQAKVGEFGEIKWDNMGEIKELDGSLTLCEYDISPELAYYKSTPF
jgi:hypothetical protein